MRVLATVDLSLPWSELAFGAHSGSEVVRASRLFREVRPAASEPLTLRRTTVPG